MRFGGFGPRLVLRSPQLLHIALYIRDNAGIRIFGDPSAPPPLRHVEATTAPRPQVTSGGLEAQWMDWWRWIAEHEATAAAISRDASFGGTAEVARQIVGTVELAFDPPEFATLTGSPDLRAIVGVLDVTGRWSHIVAPGYMLCSADVIQDDDAA